MKVKYVIVTLVCMILLIGGLISYGIYINMSSSSHIEKLATAQYSRVAVAPVAYREIVPTLYIPTLNFQTTSMLDVNVKVDGTVTRLYVAPGDKVQAGQLLGEIINTELPSQILQAEGKIKEAQANAVKCENTFKRYQSLVDQGGVSLQQLDESTANYQAAMATVMSAEAYRDQIASHLVEQRVLAPQAGDVLKLYHAVGSFMRTGEALLMIGDFSVLYAKLNIRHTDLEQLMPLDTTFKLTARNDQALDKVYDTNFRGQYLNDGHDYTVTLMQIEPPLSVAAQYRSLVWQISNPAAELEPGTYHQLKISGTQKRLVLAVPKSALIGDEEAAVFVVTSDGNLDKKLIKLGIRDDDYVQVVAGLNENDTVVVSGKVGLMPGIKVQIITDSVVQTKP